jgi:hypothetical protein
MKSAMILLLAATAGFGLSWAARRQAASEELSLSRFVPSGALLYIEAKDFAGLLGDWNGSEERQLWRNSPNHEVFSRSRLLLRLQEASEQFTAAAGLPPDMNFLEQVAGKQSAVALYDIGKLQFLFITRLPAANAMQSGLWQKRAKFTERSAGGATFFYRSDPESQREVAFAVNGEYLLLATREDLLASALQLIGGSQDRSIETEAWWSETLAAAGPAGDLRLVSHLEKIVPSPYFRSYWVQQNITDMKQYAAAVSDLFLSGREFRERRLLVKKPSYLPEAANEAGPAAAGDLLRLVPVEAGFYQVKANPSAEDCLALLESKILLFKRRPVAEEKRAPQVQFTNDEAGSGADLETRIDQAPVQPSAGAGPANLLGEVLRKNRVRALLEVQSTDREQEGVFVRFHAAVVLLGESDWNEAAVRSALVEVLRPDLTAGQLGLEWQSSSGELDGLWNLATVVRGKYLFVSGQRALLEALQANLAGPAPAAPAVFAAGFNHRRERVNFARFTGLLDRPGFAGNTAPEAGHRPEFFSENISSLSSALAGVSSEEIVVRQAGDKVIETVVYEWAR